MFTHLLTSKTLRTLAALACAACTGTSFATEPLPPAAAVAKPIAISDVTLARSVLAAFDADPILKDANILVQSVMDKGSKFTIRLPMKSAFTGDIGGTGMHPILPPPSE